MAPRPPFVDPETGYISIDRLVEEAKPLAELIGAFVLVAFVPLLLAYLGILGGLFGLLAQFVLSVGTGVALIYILVRSYQLTRTIDDGAIPPGDEPRSGTGPTEDHEPTTDAD